MQILLIVISSLLIALVLLQSGKAESSGMLTGANDSLFTNRKERGGELFITRLTYFLGFAFFIICIMIGL